MNELQTLTNQIVSNDCAKAEKTLDGILKDRAYEKVQGIKPEIANAFFGDSKKHQHVVK